MSERTEAIKVAALHQARIEADALRERAERAEQAIEQALVVLGTPSMLDVFRPLLHALGRDDVFGEHWQAAWENLDGPRRELLARAKRAEAALRDIVMWCEEGGEPVSAWPAERARVVLGTEEP